ncbi:MAG: helix-turn-helix transcriptional regulator [Betaproteobacteria bacterium]|nr:helix-turn-helix transcriptional regulator [Betaproteobacteria bacterium]
MMQVDIPPAVTQPVSLAAQAAEPVPEAMVDSETRPRRLPRLMAQLYREAAARGHSRQALAGYLGVTVGYLSQLASGTRETRHISTDFSRSCAQYLDVPPMAVMLAAGRLDLRDFRMPQTTRAPGWHLSSGLQRMAADPLVGCLMPEEVWDAPAPVQQMLVALYDARMQGTANQDHTRPLRHIPLLLQALQDAALVLADADASVAAANDMAYGPAAEVQP